MVFEFVQQIFEQIFQTLQALFINIPVNNALGEIYVILNTIAVFLLALAGGDVELPF